MKKIIGEATTYQGFDHPYLAGRVVRIVAVLKSKGRPELGLVSDDYDHLDDDAEIARAGGVTFYDYLEVEPWIEHAGRFSFASSDARAMDVELFQNLRPMREPGTSHEFSLHCCVRAPIGG